MDVRIVLTVFTHVVLGAVDRAVRHQLYKAILDEELDLARRTRQMGEGGAFVPVQVVSVAR